MFYFDARYLAWIWHELMALMRRETVTTCMETTRISPLGYIFVYISHNHDGDLNDLLNLLTRRMRWLTGTFLDHTSEKLAPVETNFVHNQSLYSRC